MSHVYLQAMDPWKLIGVIFTLNSAGGWLRVKLHLFFLHFCLVYWVFNTANCQTDQTSWNMCLGRLVDRTGWSGATWAGHRTGGATPHLRSPGVSTFTSMSAKLTLMWHWSAVRVNPNTTIHSLDDLNTSFVSGHKHHLTIFQSEPSPPQCSAYVHIMLNFHTSSEPH